jgi:ferritin-like metal-binding protein YciE
MESQETTGGAVNATADKNQKTLSDWVGDVAAIETHIEEALDRQLKQTKDDAIAGPAVQAFHDMVKLQKDVVIALRDDLGGTAGSPIKQAGASILGKAAGVIDMVRAEGLSKSLRDDYTAFNLAAVAYTMLHTTAVALGDQRVATLAESHLRGYAGAIQKINHIISDVVVAELAKDKHEVRSSAAATTKKMVDKVWKETDQSNGQQSTVA